MKTSRTSPYSGDHVIERSDARTAPFAMRLSHGTVQLIIKLFRAFQHNNYYQTTIVHSMNSTRNSTHRNSICRKPLKHHRCKGISIFRIKFRS